MEQVGIVYNSCYGGFGLSKEATELYLKKKGYSYKWVKGESEYGWDSHFEVEGIGYFWDGDIPRNDQILVEVVQELGSKANDDCSKLGIEWLAKGVAYRIEEYDGLETVVTGYDWNTA